MLPGVDRFSGDDLQQLARVVADGWRAAADRDWSVPAGGLEWSCRHTADHIVDCVLAPAFFLASRRQDAYPSGGWVIEAGAGPEVLAESLETAARVLAAVVLAADPDDHAIIWRRPRVETRGPHDFVPRGALELILHADDVATGLGIPFDPPREVCERLRRHTQSWPFWTAPWEALSMTGDPWDDLRRASGRARS